jgi:metal-sulfur cluster biosynthetic enzyme
MSMKSCLKSLSPQAQCIVDALSQVTDPEVGENIVDLGLVYGIEVNQNIATINLTLTSSACPMGEMVLEDIHKTLTKMMPSEMEFDINLVWDPPWSPDMMSAEAKQRLGWS